MNRLDTTLSEADTRAKLIDVSLNESPSLILKKLGLITDGKLTNGAIMLFGKNPQKHFINLCVRIGRSGRAGALQYVPELTWMLFLRILDEKEEKEAEQAKAVGIEFSP